MVQENQEAAPDHQFANVLENEKYQPGIHVSHVSHVRYVIIIGNVVDLEAAIERDDFKDTFYLTYYYYYY